MPLIITWKKKLWTAICQNENDLPNETKSGRSINWIRFISVDEIIIGIFGAAANNSIFIWAMINSETFIEMKKEEVYECPSSSLFKFINFERIMVILAEGRCIVSGDIFLNINGMKLIITELPQHQSLLSENHSFRMRCAYFCFVLFFHSNPYYHFS